LKIGEYKVLISAEVDAVDADGQCVEIKSGEGGPFKASNLLQLLSSGGKSNLKGLVKDNILYGINVTPVHEILAAQEESEMLNMQSNIVSMLKLLKELSESIKRDIPSEISFTGDSSFTLRPCPDISVLPKPSVIKDVMSFEQYRSTCCVI